MRTYEGFAIISGVTSFPRKPDTVKTVVIHYSRKWKSFRERLSGALRYLSSRSDVRVIRVNADLVAPDEFHQQLASACKGADGLLIVDSFTDVPPRIPVVHFELRLPRVRKAPTTRFFCDNTAIGNTAAELLMRRGHTAFSYIGCDFAAEGGISRARGNAFAKRLEREAFNCRSFTTHPDRPDELVNHLLSLPKPCGVMVYSDYFAQEVLDACHEAKLSVPDQVNIISVDNETEICESVRPQLSSIQPGFEQAGYDAAKTLMRIIETGECAPDVSYGFSRLVERQSTMDVNGSRRLVTTACAYLAAHFTERLTVATLAREMRTCRRRLELRFREILGHTVHDELERLRLDEARRLLTQTSQPVAEVAQACGYRSDDAFRKAFTAATGLTPLRYRNKR